MAAAIGTPLAVFASVHSLWSNLLASGRCRWVAHVQRINFAHVVAVLGRTGP